MNSIAFRVVPDTRYSVGQAVAISIDGRDFIELVRAHEQAFAQREGHPNIAGGYAYLPATFARPPRRHFWGDAGESAEYPGKVALAECECGCAGCWPLLCEIAAGETEVVWRNFEQPHRRHESVAGYWDYSSFGPFRFARGEYERALLAVAV